MKNKKLLGAIIIAAVLLLSVWIVFRSNDPQMVWDTLRSLKPGWVAAAFGCWFGFMLMDSVGYWLYYRRHGHPIGLLYTLYVTLLGAFYSGITPGSSGGQPMQVYYLKKAGVPVGVGTSGLAVRFALGQLSSVLIVPVVWIIHRDFINTQLAGMRFLVWIGWCIHLLGVLLILAATFFRPWVQRLADRLVALGAKLRLVRDPAAAGAKLRSVLDHYHTNMIQCLKRPGELLTQLLLSSLSVLSLMLVAVCVYYAFGLSGTSWQQVLAIAYLLYMSASYNPLPGASGAQEGGFLAFYRGIFPPGQNSLAMLVWRLFSYYMSLLAGAAALAAGGMAASLRRKDAPEEEP